MVALEFRTKSGAFGHKWAIGLTLVADDEAGLMAEMKLVKRALLDWTKRRGSNGTIVQLTFVVAAELDPTVQELVYRLRTEEVDLAPILSERRVRVATLDADGSPRLQYEVSR